MLDLYYWPTPNGHKIALFLEEAKLPYNLIPVDIAKGDQFKPDFLKISPNNKMPAIVDHEPKHGKDPLALFESGAILLYLADKTGRFIAAENGPQRYKTLQWLFWQVGGLGPMLGQHNHFYKFAPERIHYAMERYLTETKRLYTVLNGALEQSEYISGGEYTIADIACYPWIAIYEFQGIKIDDYPAVKKWYLRIKDRTATIKAYELAKKVKK